MFGWLIFFIIPTSGALYIVFSRKKRELNAVEDAAHKVPKSAWINMVWKNPSKKEVDQAKNFMGKKGKVRKPFTLKENPDGTIHREE